MSELLRHRQYADTPWNHTGFGSSLEIPTDVLRLKRYPNNSAEAAAAEAAAAVAAAAEAASSRHNVPARRYGHMHPQGVFIRLSSLKGDRALDRASTLKRLLHSPFFRVPRILAMPSCLGPNMAITHVVVPAKAGSGGRGGRGGGGEGGGGGGGGGGSDISRQQFLTNV